MSLDKAIKHGKERRKPYRKGKSVDGTCRNHGSCAQCRRNRTFSRHEYATRRDMLDYKRGKEKGR